VSFSRERCSKTYSQIQLKLKGFFPEEEKSHEVFIVMLLVCVRACVSPATSALDSAAVEPTATAAGAEPTHISFFCKTVFTGVGYDSQRKTVRHQIE